MPSLARLLYTIGHSNHPAEHLVALLVKHQIEVVADIRSFPRSRFPQHNQGAMERRLSDAGVGYVFLGDELGGRPRQPEYYDDEGHVRYDRVASSARFASGLEHLLREVDEHRVAILCSEENPQRCHRRLLLGPALTRQHVILHHIRGDGRIETDEGFERPAAQATLFDDLEGGDHPR